MITIVVGNRFVSVPAHWSAEDISKKYGDSWDYALVPTDD